MGRSGSGKSTLLHLLGAMDTPTAGRITVNDQHLETLTRPEAARYRRTVGFVFQRFHLLAALSALDNVLAPTLPIRHQPDQEPRALRLLQRVGLDQRPDALPSQLSGGQQQRVAIARALINQPGLLLADEPTGNLDTTTGTEILDLLLDLQREDGTTIIIATHDPTIAARCTRVIQLTDGQITHDTQPTTTTS
jgi:putative ABC transport system ATP-binding protein